MTLPDLSRFELQCLRLLWKREEATVRDLQEALPESPTYSTVRKIVERLEEKGAIERSRLDGKAWVYRPRVSSAQMIRKEIRRFLDVLFDGSAGPLVAHLADMDALTLDELRIVEDRLEGANTPGRRRSGPGGRRPGERTNRSAPTTNNEVDAPVGRAAVGSKRAAEPKKGRTAAAARRRDGRQS